MGAAWRDFLGLSRLATFVLFKKELLEENICSSAYSTKSWLEQPEPAPRDRHTAGKTSSPKQTLWGKFPPSMDHHFREDSLQTLECCFCQVPHGVHWVSSAISNIAFATIPFRCWSTTCTKYLIERTGCPKISCRTSAPAGIP